MFTVMKGLLSGMMVIKNRRPRRNKLKKNQCPLPSIHHNGMIGVCQKMKNGMIGVCQKMKKRRQKNYGSNR